MDQNELSTLSAKNNEENAVFFNYHGVHQSWSAACL